MRPNVELIKFLEERLADAKAGTMEGIAAVLLRPEHAVASAWAGSVDRNVYTTLAGICVLQREFEDEHIEGLKAA